MSNEYLEFFVKRNLRGCIYTYYYMDLLLKIKSKRFAKGVKVDF